MSIEQTLRAACAPREPAPEFEEAVMTRVSAAAWRASHAAPRRQLRIVLIGALFVAAAAAATLAVWQSDSPSPPATLSAQEAKPYAPGVAQTAAPVSVHAVSVGSPVVPELVPPTKSTPDDNYQQCVAAYAIPAPPRYTVLVQPLQFEMDDPGIQSAMQEYYNALLDQLRKIPGLALEGMGAQTAAATPADFRVTVAWIDNRGRRAPSGSGATWGAELQLEARTGAAFGRTFATSRDGRTLDANNCPSASGQTYNCGPAGAAAADVLHLGSQLPGFPTPAQAACADEFENLIAQQRGTNPTPGSPMAREMLQRLAVATTPTTRSTPLGALRQVRPEHVQSLLTALRAATDEAFRKEVVTLLAVKFADDPAVREALAAVAASGPDTLMRHVAERAVSGDGPWRDYVVARVRDTSLPTAQRLEPMYWMADAMRLDQQRMSAAMADVLTALQDGGGVRVLADLLVGTHREGGESGNDLAGEWGKWAMRQIGSVNHPAASDLLIACFEAMPVSSTLTTLATRRDDPRISSKLESIAAEHADPQLRNLALGYLRQPPERAQTITIGTPFGN